LVDVDFKENASYVTIPRVSVEPKKFEQALQKGEYFDLVDYDSEINDSPSFVICGNYAYKVKGDDDWDLLSPSTTNTHRWKCSDYEKVAKIDLLQFDEYKTDTIRATENLVFVERNLASAILVSDKYLPSEEEIEKQPHEVKTDNNPVATAKAAQETLPESVEEQPDEFIEDDSEIQFIKCLSRLTLDNGLQYEYNDLINFHTSIKTNPLTILAGMSGTGKSRLALNYAKMLDLSEDNGTLLFMPISPSYTEPNDVLGYLNTMNGLYVPSETGMVQFLQHASSNPDQMHMVIFDEMNLSQVEFWFSPFISILEKDKGERFLRLYDEDAHCINEKVYPPTIKIGENIIFIGTVNIDDTTKEFSDRLLDRTFVITLNKVSFVQFYGDYLKHKPGVEKVDLAKFQCKNVTEFKKWSHGDDRRYMDAFANNQSELEFLDELSDLIKKYIPNGGISHRVMKNIGNYLLNVPRTNLGMVIDRRDVFDIILDQTIMTKIRGTETQLQQLIGELKPENILEDSELTKLFDKYTSISDFDRVKKSLVRKAEELKINGYTN
jgi:hypothetical protein